MLRHVAMWRFADDSEPGRNREAAIKIKAGLEELAYEVHSLRRIDPPRGGDSSADIFVESLFENREAFLAYLDSPRHEVINQLLDSFMEERLVMNFEEDEEDAGSPPGI